MIQDPNHPINIASRQVTSAIDSLKERSGPNYRYWEDGLDDAIAKLAFAVVDEVVERLKETV